MVSVRRLVLPLLALLPVLNGCASKKVEVAAPPPPPPAPAVAAPMPRPPLNAAPNLVLPIPAADGSVTTPNRGLTAAATLWHLRSALNVAALQCGAAGDPIETAYNGFLAAHKSALATAHRAVAGEYKTSHGKDAQDAFDDAMTRLYNFYAQPPVRNGFCAIARPLVAQAAATPSGSLPSFAVTALAQLDAPFADFYRSYAAYRVELAAWQAGRTRMASAASPRLEVDPAILMSDTGVSMRGRIRTAAR